MRQILVLVENTMAEKLCTNLEDVRRTCVVGTSGSGKSTFAKQLAELTGNDHLELDSFYWLPDWTEEDPDKFHEKIAAAISSSDRWVLDGNYHSKVSDLKRESATSVIWIDHSFPRTLFRAVKRAVTRAWTQKELWPGTGNRETFRKSFFSHDSVVLWTMTSFRGIRKRYSTLMNDPDWKHIKFFRLRGRKQVIEFLESVKASMADSNNET